MNNIKSNRSLSKRWMQYSKNWIMSPICIRTSSTPSCRNAICSNLKALIWRWILQLAPPSPLKIFRRSRRRFRVSLIIQRRARVKSRNITAGHDLVFQVHSRNSKKPCSVIGHKLLRWINLGCLSFSGKKMLTGCGNHCCWVNTCRISTFWKIMFRTIHKNYCPTRNNRITLRVINFPTI